MPAVSGTLYVTWNPSGVAKSTRLRSRGSHGGSHKGGVTLPTCFKVMFRRVLASAPRRASRAGRAEIFSYWGVCGRPGRGASRYARILTLAFSRNKSAGLAVMLAEKGLDVDPIIDQLGQPSAR